MLFISHDFGSVPRTFFVSYLLVLLPCLLVSFLTHLLLVEPKAVRKFDKTIICVLRNDDVAALITQVREY